jgi:hypothetical protein
MFIEQTIRLRGLTQREAMRDPPLWLDSPQRIPRDREAA